LFGVIEYVILGTPHPLQGSDECGQRVQELIKKHAVDLVAEEYPFTLDSKVCCKAKSLGRQYLQVDALPNECRNLGIDAELDKRARAACLQGRDVRFSHADSLREQFWLEKIEKKIQRGRVLIVCGYLHSNFLAEKIRERGSRLLEIDAFPQGLLGSQPEEIFTPAELDEYLKKHGECFR
jgi:hypothetical protein